MVKDGELLDLKSQSSSGVLHQGLPCICSIFLPGRNTHSSFHPPCEKQRLRTRNSGVNFLDPNLRSTSSYVTLGKLYYLLGPQATHVYVGDSSSYYSTATIFMRIDYVKFFKALRTIEHRKALCGWLLSYYSSFACLECFKIK